MKILQYIATVKFPSKVNYNCYSEGHNDSIPPAIKVNLIVIKYTIFKAFSP